MDLSQLTPEQKQAVLMRAQQEANQKITQDMLASMTEECFKKCAGSSGSNLDNREKSCMAMCQDRFIDTRQAVMAALEKRQGGM